MRRREFITLLGGVAAAVWPARAQQAGMRRIAVLIGLFETDQEGQDRIAAFRKGLRQLGWVEGRNLHIEYRWTGPDPARLQAGAAELVALGPDLIFAASGTPLAALHRATRTIPIVFANAFDPVSDGFVNSWAQPAGNITGFPLIENEATVKWLELLKQIAPHVSRASVIYDPAQPSSSVLVRTIESAGPQQRVEVFSAAVRDAAEIEHAIAAFAVEPNGGLVVLPSTVTVSLRATIIRLAARLSLPAIYPYRSFVAEGGLVSYGAEFLDLYRRAASYVDRILKREKPGELPIQGPIKYELVINLKAATALGLDLPISLLARTDEVIE